MKKTVVAGKGLYLVQGTVRWGIYDLEFETIVIIDRVGGQFLAAFLESGMSPGEKKQFLRDNCDPLWKKLCDLGVAERVFALDDAVMTISKGLDLIWVELTERCNQKCIHCYAESEPNRSITMSYDLVSQVIKEASELRFSKIQLTGGEPFLHPKIWEIINLACASVFDEVEIYTNLTLVDELGLMRLKKLEVKLATSLLGFDSESHDKCTQIP
ncbi:MAG: radical SAM protein [Nitrospirae bacterium]|nr:radical SAM protein [Nitrospirota bacterium]